MADETTQVASTEASAATVEKVEMPPELQKQFNKIYGEMKKAKERNSALEDHALKLTNALSKLQSDSKESANKGVVADIKSQIKAAREAGDDEAMDALQDKLTELTVEAKLEKKLPKPAAPAPKQEDDGYNFSTSEQKMVEKWVKEVDEEDEPLRPWAKDAEHPKAKAAYAYLMEVLNDEEHEDLTIKEKLALVDEKFLRKAKTTRDVNAVGSGSLTNPNTNKQDKLTDDQKRVAHRIFSKLSKEDAEKNYAAGLKLTGGK